MIKKPQVDDRLYRSITLPNKLQALLVSDPETDKASAALDVGVGSFQDPSRIPGLAHFLEHLLFLGTEKYPKENDYSEFLSQHGGSSNAYTSSTHTNYYFDVGYADLTGAFDRLAQFFIAPIFGKDGVERELNAVDSEFKKNLQSDSRRMYQILKSSSDPKHPFNRFDCGNWETLRDGPKLDPQVDVLQELLAFHKKYYSANLMRLVVLGRESLDELELLVTSRFSAVKNMDVHIPITPGHPLTVEHGLRQVILVKPVKDFRRLAIHFAVPDQSVNWHTKPMHYASHLIGHESAGSVLSVIKKRGWATSLSSGAADYARGFDIFSVNIELTKEGLVHYQEILVLVFQYIKMIREAPVQEWIFKECSTIAEIGFRFKEKGSASGFTSGTASRMHDYPAEYVLKGPYAMDKYDPKIVSDMLKCLVAENAFFAIVSQKLEAFSGVTFDNEKWYGTESAKVPLSAEQLQTLSQVSLSDELHLPVKNDFLPENLDVNRKLNSTVTYPRLIRDDDVVRLWHKEDCKFLVPKENAFFIIKSPANQTPYQAVLMKIYVELVKESLTEYSYMAEVAGLGYSLDAGAEGLYCSFAGISDKLHVLVHSVFEKMRNIEISQSLFDLQKEKLTQTYKNWSKEAPNQHAMYHVTQCFKDVLWTPGEKLEQLKTIQGPVEVYAFMNDFFRMFYIESFMHGDCSQKSALESVDMVYKTLSAPSAGVASYALLNVEPRPSQPLPHQLVNVTRGHVLPNSSSYSIIRHGMDPENPNSAIEYFMQTGDATDSPTRARTYVLAQMLHEAAFNQLRTKEQLGYIVWSSIRKNIGLIGIRIVIQSERDTIFLENRIDSFLKEFQSIAAAASEGDLNKYKNATIHQLAQRDENLSQETTRWWNSIQDGYCEFNRVDTDVANVKLIHKEDLLSFYDQWLMPGSESRRKLSVHIRSRKEFPPQVIAESAEIPMTIVAKLQEALREYHGIQINDQDLISLVGTDLSVTGSSSIVESQSSESLGSLELAAATDDGLDSINFKELAAKIAVKVNQQGSADHRASSVTTEDDSKLQKSMSKVSLDNNARFGSFAFATHTQIVMEDDAWDLKNRFPLTDVARPLVPEFLTVDE